MKFDEKTWDRIRELAGRRRAQRDAPPSSPTSGVCRVCACTDEIGCPEGCFWVDEEHTLCSSCAILIDDGYVREHGRQRAPAVPGDFRRDFEELATRRRPLVLEMTQVQGWILLSALQLALRHPTFPASLAASVECLARTLQVTIATTPALARVAEQGWDRAHDVEAG